MNELHFFDPRSEFSIFERRLPHWTQSGVVCFVTWRMDDSIPTEVLERWRTERRTWLRSHGINPRSPDWKQQLSMLDAESQYEFYDHFSTRWHDELDRCHGACVLKSQELANIVAESLLAFDGDRYDMLDFVVMPNHIHFLAAFRDGDSMIVEFENWKHYQARQINRALGTSGRFWQRDGFDHLVRSAEQFDHFRRYIANNPVKAHLPKDHALVWSKTLSGGENALSSELESA